MWLLKQVWLVRTQRNYHKLQTAHNKFEMCPTALEGFTEKHMYFKIKISENSNTNYRLLPLEISYQDGRVRIPLESLTPPHFCACPKPGAGFPMLYVMVFFIVCVQWVNMRSDCSFCWNYWNCWRSVVKISFHNLSWLMNT